MSTVDTSIPANFRVEEQKALIAEGGTLTLGQYGIKGVSVAGQETCIIVPQLKAVFDTGRCPQAAVYQPNLFITHPHMDHIGGVPFYVASRGLLSLAPPTVVLPPSCVEATRRLIEVHRELDTSDMACTLAPLGAGERHALRNGAWVETFPTFHPVASQGYIVYGCKHKLKAEYIGREGKEIGALKKSGVEVTYPVVTPEFAFTGDTSADFITAPGAADALKAKVLVMECSFLDDSVDVADAERMGHMHIDRLIEHADAFQNEHILLVHFSSRYSPERVVELLAEKLPERLRSRCVPWLAGFVTR